MKISKAEAISVAVASHPEVSPPPTSSVKTVVTESGDEELRGAEILVKALQAEGVKYIWGYPGGAVLHIYDAFYKQDTIQHILVRHEQAAVHAADGYARATGDVGVALVTSGPGVTNAVTGIATAYMDSIPMVIITGQVPTHAIGLDAFQECDAVGITRPVVKHNFLVKDARDLASTMKKAFHIARTGRPGPWDLDKVYSRFPRLKDRANQLGNSLSGGEQQMLAIGRALMTNPTLLILDEATEGLAPMIRQEIWSVLAELKAEGQTTLVIDKNLDDMARLADDNYVIVKGQIAWHGDVAAMRAEDNFAEKYLGV